MFRFGLKFAGLAPSVTFTPVIGWVDCNYTATIGFICCITPWFCMASRCAFVVGDAFVFEWEPAGIHIIIEWCTQREQQVQTPVIY